MTPAYHSIAVSILTGTFFLAFLATVTAFWAARNGREQLLAYASFGARWTAAIGFVLATAGIVTGIFLWPAAAILNSPLLKNKIFTVVMILPLWGMFLWILYRKGQDAWRMSIYRHHLLILAIVGFLANVISNSIGGDVAGNPSGFEQMIRLFGVETRFTFYLPGWFNIGLLVTALLVVILPSWRPSDRSGNAGEKDRVHGAS